MTREQAIRELVSMWLDDGNVAAHHRAWFELADSIGLGDEARAVMSSYEDWDDPMPKSDQKKTNSGVRVRKVK